MAEGWEFEYGDLHLGERPKRGGNIIEEAGEKIAALGREGWEPVGVVTFSFDNPGGFSPPTSVQASPVVTPTMSSLSASPKRNRRTPAYLSRLRRVTLIRSLFFIKMSLIAFRVRLAISRSRLRTPASRV